jgi:gliding motility-associated-like protein
MTITVTDDENPVVTATADIAKTTSFDGTGNCTTDIAIPNAAISDNSSISSLTWTMTGATIGNSPATGINQVGTHTFNIGVTTITYTITDGSGNTAQDQMSVTVTDDENPVVTPAADINASTSGDGGDYCIVRISIPDAAVSDNCTIQKLIWAIAGATNANSPATGINQVGNLIFNIGTSTITYTITDATGNSSTAQMKVRVSDDEKPVITAPAAVVVNSDPGKCTASGVNLGVPVTTDNCSVASVSNNAVEPFAPGMTTITWMVTDGSGNTQTATQVVTVIDTEKPVIVTAPATMFVYTDAGQSTASNINLVPPVVTDNCSVATVTNNAVEPYPMGETIVTWTVTDQSGNSVTTTQKIMVSDQEKPTFTKCLHGTDQNVNTDSGVRTYTNPGSSWDPMVTDNDAVISVKYDLSGVTTGSGTTLQDLVFNKGVTQVTWTAIDKSGNVSTCTFNVNVTDNENPLITKCLDGEDIVIKTPRKVSWYRVQFADYDVQSTDNDQVASVTYQLSGVTNGNGTSLKVVDLNAGKTLVTWTVKDSSGNSSTCSFNITVLDSNLPPSALDDQYTGKTNLSLKGNVRENDTDLTVPVDSLKASLTVPPIHGKVIMSEDGTFVYTPQYEFAGEDHFTYKICKPDDATLCGEAKVTLSIYNNSGCAIQIPEGFSPNGDGINDYFRIKCIANYPNTVLQIYTRSGVKVYEQEHYGNIDYWGSEENAWWNGQTGNKLNVGGSKLMNASYIYILELEKETNNVKTGTLFLNQ